MQMCICICKRSIRMDVQKIRTKEEVSESTWEKIREILEERNISQIQLRDMCVKQGYKISQPDISKLFSGKKALTLYHLAAFSAVLNVSIDSLVNDRNQYQRFQTQGEMFIRNPSDTAFNGYLGTFHTIFCSTSPFGENQIMRGQIHFRPSADKDICETIFELDTGEKSNCRSIIKYYHGQMIVSRMGVAYCILANDKIGEISMIEFKHRFFSISQVECWRGLALTTMAGGKRNPVVHQILLSRSFIEDNDLRRVMPFLKIENADQSLIKKDAMNCLVNDEVSLAKVKAMADTDEYMLIDQKILPMINRQLSRSQIAEVRGKLKANSYNGYRSILNEEDDDAIFDILRDIMNNHPDHSKEKADLIAYKKENENKGSES